jgi:hypothetical protein
MKKGLNEKIMSIRFILLLCAGCTKIRKREVEEKYFLIKSQNSE